MKKTLSVLLTFSLLFTAAFFVKASVSENRIYSDDSVAEKGATVEIPVKIANNTGFMGFSVCITYNPDEFEPVSVSGSSMLSGMLDNSIESSSTNSFIVLYTGTSDITSDGELFTVCFKVKAAIAGDKSIVLSYNQEDTFDENWNDVIFNCENLRIIVTVGGVNEEPSSSNINPSEPTTNSEGDNQDENMKLSERIRRWASGLIFPFNYIMSFILFPVIWIITIFE